MTIHAYLMKAIQDDARRAGQRDRLLREARRARRARRQGLVPAAPARRRTEMGKIVVSENVTLDGVIQDLAGDEGFRARGWVGLIGNSPQLANLALDEALAARALLLGRRSYEWLAARWPSRSGELADGLNSLPKYVVSTTLEHPAWNNSTVLKGDVLNEVSTLKQHTDGDIVIAGSFQLVRTLIEHDLASCADLLKTLAPSRPRQYGLVTRFPPSHTAQFWRDWTAIPGCRSADQNGGSRAAAAASNCDAA